MEDEVKIPNSEKCIHGTDWGWFESFVKTGGPQAAARMRRWNEKRGGPRYREVKNFLASLQHDVLHRIPLSEIEEVAHLRGGEPTKHALHDVFPEDGKYAGINNFSPPFAIEYLLHDCLETLGRVPRWKDFRNYILKDKRERYYEPFLKTYNLTRGGPGTALGDPHMKALHWRIGTAFYSFLREIHLLTSLRESFGLDVRYHVLADVEFKADLVAGETLVALYVPSEYRDGYSGRKTSITEANPARKTIELRVEVRRDYGKPWVVYPQSLQEIAAKLEAGGCPRLRPI
jgi:hypothetical protein